jgi:hypothetical protein
MAKEPHGNTHQVQHQLAQEEKEETHYPAARCGYDSRCGPFSCAQEGTFHH